MWLLTCACFETSQKIIYPFLVRVLSSERINYHCNFIGTTFRASSLTQAAASSYLPKE